MEVARQAVTTSLIHRRGIGSDWWTTAAICDLPGALDESSLRRAMGFLPDIADLGFQAVLLRPADPDVDRGLTNLSEFVSAAHDLDLRVIVRAFLTPDGGALAPDSSPPELPLSHDTAELNRRARAILATGADGVDLGPVNDEESSPDAAKNAAEFSRAVQAQLAEVELAGLELAGDSGTAILTAAILSEPRESALRHLQDDWFHHLRDDSLVGCPWDAQEIQRRVRQAYADRDPFGHVAAWRYSLPRWTSSPLIRTNSDSGWAASKAHETREMAMLLYAASLPGAVYVPFLNVGGGVKASTGKKPGLKFTFEKGREAKGRAQLAWEALNIRNDLSLADRSLAVVTGLPWANPDVAVHLTGPLMVVLNTGTKPVVVPPEHRPLLSSLGFIRTGADGSVVRQDCCTWFATAQLEPARPRAYR